MNYCKAGWTPVTTELRGDRWMGRMRIVSALAKMFDVPMDVVQTTHVHANAADEAAEQAEWVINTVAVAATDFVMHGEAFYEVKDGKVTHIPHEQIHTTPCIGNDPGCPCQDGLACHYRDYPAEDGWPAVKGWVIPE